jgi:hypothetical protein
VEPQDVVHEGRGERSCKPAAPSARNRATHLATVFGVVLNRRAATAFESPPSNHAARHRLSTSGRKGGILVRACACPFGSPRIPEVWRHQRSRLKPNGQPPERPQLSYVAGPCPDARPLDRGKPRDEDTEGGNQPADKSLINRRLSLRSHSAQLRPIPADGFLVARVLDCVRVLDGEHQRLAKHMLLTSAAVRASTGGARARRLPPAACGTRRASHGSRR